MCNGGILQQQSHLASGRVIYIHSAAHIHVASCTYTQQHTVKQDSSSENQQKHTTATHFWDIRAVRGLISEVLTAIKAVCWPAVNMSACIFFFCNSPLPYVSVVIKLMIFML